MEMRNYKCIHLLRRSMQNCTSLKVTLACLAVVARTKARLECRVHSWSSFARSSMCISKRAKLIIAIAALGLLPRIHASATNFAAINNHCPHSIRVWSIDRNNESTLLSVTKSLTTHTTDLQHDVTIRLTGDQLSEDTCNFGQKGRPVICDESLRHCVQVELLEKKPDLHGEKLAARQKSNETNDSCYCCSTLSESAAAQATTQTPVLGQITPPVLDQPARSTDNPSSTQASASQHSTLPRVSAWSVPKTCPWDIPWPLPDTPMPVVDNVDIPQLSIFPRPTAVHDTVTVYNFCDYDLWLESNVGNVVAGMEQIFPGRKLDRLFHAGERGHGINFKVSRAEADFTNPVQVEYMADEYGKVWYDLSLIDCLGKTGEIRNGKPVRNGNTSACAGHEAGLQIGNENANATTFQCAAGAWCDDQVYLYEASQRRSRKCNGGTASY
jgi:hypothetical protein